MRKFEGYFLIILSGALYGTIPIFATLLARLNVSTMEQIFVRLFLSIIAFMLFFLIARGKLPKLEGRDYKYFFIFGLGGIALLFSLYMSAAVMTSVTITVLLLYTQPIYTLILSKLIFKKKISPWGVAAIVLSLAGVAVIFKIWSLHWQQFGLGHIFGLCSGLLYSIYIIFMRIYSRKYITSTITFWSFLFGLAWLILLWPIYRVAFPMPEVSSLRINLELNAWLLLLGFTIIPTLMAYLIFNHGIKHVEPHKAGVLVLTEPLAAIIMGALILSQAMVLTDLLGGLLILTAFFMTRLDRS
jgi:DME family drug/metabolite transporter